MTPYRLLRPDLREIDHPDFWEVRGKPLQVLIVRLSNRPLHVRLAGTNPHFTHEDIRKAHFGTSLNTHRQRSANLHRGQLHFPVAIRIGLPCNLGITNRYGDTLTRIVLTPNLILLLLLKNHRITEHIR